MIDVFMDEKYIGQVDDALKFLIDLKRIYV